MDAKEDKERRRQRRIAVSRRLSDCYAQLKGIVAVDTEDFYRRVMEQAARRERETHAKSVS